MLWPKLLTVPWITLLGKSKLTCVRSLNKPLGLKVTPSVGSLFDLLDFDLGLGDHGSEVQTLEIILLIIIAVSLVHSILSKSFKCASLATNQQQMTSLRMEHQQRNAEKDWLKKNYRPKVMTLWISETWQKTSWSVNVTQRIGKSCKTTEWQLRVLLMT